MNVPQTPRKWTCMGWGRLRPEREQAAQDPDRDPVEHDRDEEPDVERRRDSRDGGCGPRTVRLQPSTARRTTPSPSDGSSAWCALWIQRLTGQATNPMTAPAPPSAVMVWTVRLAQRAEHQQPRRERAHERGVDDPGGQRLVEPEVDGGHRHPREGVGDQHHGEERARRGQGPAASCAAGRSGRMDG